MKLKYIILAFLTSLLFLFCSKSDSEPFDWNTGLGDLNLHGLWVYDIIYDDCNCPLEFELDCQNLFFMKQEEKERLMKIIEQSTDSCIYIIGVNNGGDTFEGYYKK